MATVNIKAPASAVGSKVVSEFGVYGPVPASRVLAIDSLMLPQLMMAGWADPGIIPTGGANGDDLNKASTTDFDLTWAA